MRGPLAGLQMRSALGFVIVLTAVSVACAEMERIPADTEIREWPALRPFLLHPSSITGVYRNFDVDAVVFHYESKITDEAQFWRRLRHQAQEAGWLPAKSPESGDGSRGYEAFQRLKPKGELMFASAEELRVAFLRDRVVVAYVQSDQSGEPTPVSQAAEGRFANQQIWPRFLKLLSSTAG
jgi:hypothetical protein